MSHAASADEIISKRMFHTTALGTVVS